MKKTYENFLKEFQSKYKVKRDADSIYCILCKKGHIKPHNLECSELFAHLEFKSKREKTFFLKNRVDELEISVDGDFEVIFVFPTNKLSKYASYLQIIRKRNISPEHKAKIIENLRRGRQK